MKTAVIIPARLQSTRLPGKPLADIQGRPMVMRVWDRCVEAVSPDSVVIATDDPGIANVCRDGGAKVVMTGDCLTGTDRVAEAARLVPAELYVNVQGDEPLVAAADIEAVIRAASDFPDAIINAMAPITDAETWRSRTVPKVVAAPDGRLLYMSRAAMPAGKSEQFPKLAQRQVCIYAFPPEALRLFSECRTKTPLEMQEDIEILRFLEMGQEVRMVQLLAGSMAVDTPEDLIRVQEYFR